MGAARSVESRQRQFSGQLDKQLDVIRSQLALVSVPEHTNELGDILPYYKPLFEKMESEASLHHIAATHLLVNFHAQVATLSNKNEALTRELEQYHCSLRTLCTNICTSKNILFEGCDVDVDKGVRAMERIKDWTGRELLCTIQYQLNGINDVQRQLAGVFKSAVRACDTLEMAFEREQETCTRSVRLREELLAEQEEALCKIIASGLFHKEVPEEIRVLEKKHDDCLAMFLDFKTRNVKLSLRENQLLQGMKSRDEEKEAILKSPTEQIGKLDADGHTKEESTAGELDTDVNFLYPVMKRQRTSAHHWSEIARLREEIEVLRQHNSDMEDELQVANQAGAKMADILQDQLLITDDAMKTGKVVEQLKVENSKLKEENNKIGNLKREICSPRAQVKQENVRGLREQLRQTRTRLQAAHSLLKRREASGETEPATNSAKDNAESVDVEAAGSHPDLTFTEDAVKLFRRQKATLRELKQTVSNMKEARGGQGWSIVDRADSLLDEKTTLLINDIDHCLALLGPGHRPKTKELDPVAEGLETKGASPLQTADPAASQGSAYARKGDTAARKSKKKKGKAKN